ncbi:hypothetical protein M501DRAFT_871866 [Patellaria atrata CBS 101060]|uniref:Small ribosomal subunit protein mS38 n=1 Tax=Patellaria atrata CBS 101060 TaxID=1346257 RepID=A0A9P4S981_9PEZI|nr:hypothetical protein M501DRAFT_871866 [Patellaria atrata CBS 101060]
MLEMFAPSISRAVRSTCTSSVSTSRSSNAPIIGALPTHLSAQCCRRVHQRRHSSSKIDGARGSDSLPEAQGQTSAKPKADGEKRTTGRGGRRRTKDNGAAAQLKGGNATALKVPVVQMTNHLQEKDVSLASFFALHRPISVHATGFPKPTTTEVFNNLFEMPEPHKLIERTLQDTISSLESTYISNEERAARKEFLNASMGSDFATHLDSPPTVVVQQYASEPEMRPFHPPPPPKPMKNIKASDGELSEPVPQGSLKKQVAWSTSIIVTESTYGDGSKEYSATTSPVVQVPVPPKQGTGEDAHIVIRQTPAHQPFLDRMRSRQLQFNESREEKAIRKQQEMMLISVKRQRKLKMKKHKYKKLMKKTRNLRRRLDRN